MSDENKMSYATWSIRLMVDCPSCNKYVDLLGSPHNADELPDGETFGGEPQDAVCPECGHVFKCEFMY